MFTPRDGRCLLVLPQEGHLREERGEEEKKEEEKEEEKDKLLSWTSSVATVWVPGQLLLMTPLRFSPHRDSWKSGHSSTGPLIWQSLVQCLRVPWFDSRYSACVSLRWLVGNSPTFWRWTRILRLAFPFVFDSLDRCLPRLRSTRKLDCSGRRHQAHVVFDAQAWSCSGYTLTRQTLWNLHVFPREGRPRITRSIPVCCPHLVY